MFVNYAHRGASAYAAENTLGAFELGARMGANGIETDVRMTSDGVLVLFHDELLDKVTDARGRIADYTLSQLSGVRVTGRAGQSVAPDAIPTLEAFLDRYSASGLQLAIELKADDIEAPVLAALGRYNARENVVITAFEPHRLKNVRALDAGIRTGWLMRDIAGAEQAARELALWQVCPKAGTFTCQDAERWHRAGLDMRAWGVADEALMISALDAGADGMTVNFPDLLIKERARRGL